MMSLKIWLKLTQKAKRQELKRRDHNNNNMHQNSIILQFQSFLRWFHSSKKLIILTYISEEANIHSPNKKKTTTEISHHHRRLSLPESSSSSFFFFLITSFPSQHSSSLWFQISCNAVAICEFVLEDLSSFFLHFQAFVFCFFYYRFNPPSKRVSWGREKNTTLGVSSAAGSADCGAVLMYQLL